MMFDIIYMDMTGYICTDEIALLLTSTPAPEATSNKIAKEQLQRFLDQNKIKIAIIDCEPIHLTNINGVATIWPRGTYSKEDMCAKAINTFTNRGETVIDPYCGGSYTGEIALKLGRNYIGIDTDSHCIGTSRIRCQRILDGHPTRDERFIPT